MTALAPSNGAKDVVQKTTTTKSVLVILMSFTDSPAVPFSQAQVQSVFAGGTGEVVARTPEMVGPVTVVALSRDGATLFAASEGPAKVGWERIDGLAHGRREGVLLRQMGRSLDDDAEHVGSSEKKRARGLKRL